MRAIAAALLLLTATLAVLAALPSDRRIYRDRAREAVVTGVLGSRAKLPLAASDKQPYVFGQNDCLILAMLGNSQGNRLVDALGPSTPRGDIPAPWRSQGFDRLRGSDATARPLPPVEHCYLLARTIDASRPPLEGYTRYVHGSTALAGIILLLMPFSALAGLYLLIGILCSAGLAIGCLAGPDPDRRQRMFGTIGIATLLFSGMYYFGRTLDLGPAHILLAAIPIITYRRPLLDGSSRTAFVVSLLGAACAALEFLTALLPSAVILLLGIMALDPQGEDRLRRGARLMIAFAGAFALTMVFKWGLAAGLGGQDLLSTTSTLAAHTGGAPVMSEATRTLIDRFGLEQLASSPVARLFWVAFALSKLVYFSDLVAFGSRPLGILICAVGPFMVLAYAVVRAVRPTRRLDRRSALLLLAAALVPLAWVFLFVEYSLTNAIFMQRMLPWVTIVGFAALARGREADDQQPVD